MLTARKELMITQQYLFVSYGPRCYDHTTVLVCTVVFSRIVCKIINLDERYTNTSVMVNTK